MLSLKTHNILDYVAGGALVLLSSAVAEIPAARALFLLAGFGQIGYSLMTNYRYSLARLIPLGIHMGLDSAAGVLVLIGPWLFGYANALTGGQIGLHVGLGAGLLALVAFTDRKSETGWDSIRRNIESRKVEKKFETAGRR